MMPLLMTTAKMSIVLGVALAATAALKNRSAALRHWVLAAGLLLAAITPLAERALPPWPIVPAWATAAPPAAAVRQSVSWTAAAVDMTPAGRPSPAARAWSPLGMTGAIWLAGAVASLGCLAFGWLRLRTLARRAEPVRRGRWAALSRRIGASHGLAQPITVLQSSHPTLLVTWGVRKPIVFLPAAARSWTAERIRMVLHHEIAHIRRGDSVVLVAAAVVRSLCWFNPLVWIVCRRLRDESERACDDIVLRHVDASAYATHLIDIARAFCDARRIWLPAPGVVQQSTLERRVRAMLDTRCDRAPLTGRMRLASALALTSMSLVVAVAALAAAAPDPAPVTVASIPTVAATPVPSPRAGRPPMANAAQAGAPQGRGSVSGTIVDQLGGLVPGTEVTLTSAASGGAFVTIADAGAQFRFTDLRPGTYTLQASLPGFQIARTSVTVIADRSVGRTLTLPLGTLQETITVTGERGAAPQPVPPPGNPWPSAAAIATAEQSLAALAEQTERVRRSGFRPGSIGGQIKQPMKLRHVNPVYPAPLQAAGVEGVVALVARVGVDGYVVEALEAREADVNPPVHPDLVAAAIAAVREWRFSPTLLNGVPVEVNMRVSVAFALR